MAADRTPLTIVVSSGRCGSTAISDLLRQHPRVLSLSEFFRCIGPRAFQPGSYTGRQFWALLARPRPSMTALLRYRLEPAEVCYPLDGRMRYNRETGVPPVLLIAFPHLTDDPDGLFDETREFSSGLPEQPLPAHFRRLFCWLCQRLRRDVVVERSGASLAMAADLIRAFPEARFIHLYRDGRRVAVSMSRHISFRLQLAVQHLTGSDHPDTVLDQLGSAALAGALKEPRDLVTLSTESRIEELLTAIGLPRERWHSPVWRFGAVWTAMISTGAGLLGKLGDDRALGLDFDDILAGPQAALSTIDRYLFPGGGGPETAKWPGESASILRPSPGGWSTGLTDVDRRRLEIACRGGMKLLYGSAVRGAN